jgi:hypothetical protein
MPQPFAARLCNKHHKLTSSFCGRKTMAHQGSGGVGVGVGGWGGGGWVVGSAIGTTIHNPTGIFPNTIAHIRLMRIQGAIVILLSNVLYIYMLGFSCLATLASFGCQSMLDYARMRPTSGPCFHLPISHALPWRCDSYTMQQLGQTQQ